MKTPMYRFSFSYEKRINHSFEMCSDTEIRSASDRLDGGSSSSNYETVANHLARVCSAQQLWELNKLGLTTLVRDVRQRKMSLGLLPTPPRPRGIRNGKT